MKCLSNVNADPKVPAEEQYNYANAEREVDAVIVTHPQGDVLDLEEINN